VRALCVLREASQGPNSLMCLVREFTLGGTRALNTNLDYLSARLDREPLIRQTLQFVQRVPRLDALIAARK
jgi:hypothetical protein